MRAALSAHHEGGVTGRFGVDDPGQGGQLGVRGAGMANVGDGVINGGGQGRHRRRGEPEPMRSGFQCGHNLVSCRCCD